MPRASPAWAVGKRRDEAAPWGGRALPRAPGEQWGIPSGEGRGDTARRGRGAGRGERPTSSPRRPRCG